jgi:high-affinity nickel-transport protein
MQIPPDEARIVGMCLVDTIDGSLMMTLYTSTSLAKDQIAILYYSIVLTLITVAVAMVIGIIQLLSLILHVAEPTGRFWDGVQVAGDHYEVIGEHLVSDLSWLRSICF